MGYILRIGDYLHLTTIWRQVNPNEPPRGQTMKLFAHPTELILFCGLSTFDYELVCHRLNCYELCPQKPFSKNQDVRGDQAVRGSVGDDGVSHPTAPVHRPTVKHPRYRPGEPAAVQGTE